MIRNVLAFLLVGAAVGLFVFLVYQSQPVPLDHQRDHNAIANQIAQSIDDYQALIQTLADARQSAQPVSAAAQGIINRFDAAEQRLRERIVARSPETVEEQELVDRFLVFSASVKELRQAGQDFVRHQNALARALQELRGNSPEVIQELRAAGRRDLSHETFSLVTTVLDYARMNSAVDPQTVISRLNAMSDKDAPARLGALLYSARTVLDETVVADRAWAELSDTQFIAHAERLSATHETIQRALLGEKERYRLLLSVYSSLLLLGLGFLGLRLYQSYRALNQTNEELEELNENLEEHVKVRTEELAQAYDSLKESQVQLVQAAKMSSLGQLVAGVSHEINTPLLYLRSNATLIKERLDAISEFVDEVEGTLSLVRGPNADKQRFLAGLQVVYQRITQDGITEDIADSSSLIQDSIEGLEQLSDMAQSLKDFSRLDRAPVAKYHVNDGLDKTLLIARNMLKQKVTVHKHYSEVPEITCSPTQINQVFLNLITNATQAIDQEGDIVITTKHEGDYVSVSISDTGCGIPDDVVAKIRDPFFTTKDVGHGTGLGLSIVDKIIESHSGELQIKSEVGKGSAFTVILPVDPQLEGVGESELTPAAEEKPMAAAV